MRKRVTEKERGKEREGGGKCQKEKRRKEERKKREEVFGSKLFREDI